jgi:hypothetical protein
MGRCRFVKGLLGEAEVEHLGVPAFGDENIGGLNVTMNDPFGVGGVQSIGDFDANGN